MIENTEPTGPKLFLFFFLFVLLEGWFVYYLPLLTTTFSRLAPRGRRLYRLGIKVDYGGMDERYAMNKTIASQLNDPCSVIAALR